MELYQLEELAALAEYGSISKAAESVGVSQPAMSRAMKLLETDIGVPIKSSGDNHSCTESHRGNKGVRQKEEDDSCRFCCPGAAVGCHLDAFFL